MKYNSSAARLWIVSAALLTTTLTAHAENGNGVDTKKPDPAVKSPSLVIVYRVDASRDVVEIPASPTPVVNSTSAQSPKPPVAPIVSVKAPPVESQQAPVLEAYNARTIEVQSHKPEATPTPAAPADSNTTFWTRDTLSGDWGGARKTLADRGLDFTFTYKADVFGNVAGGLQRKAVYLGNLDLILDVDAEKLIGWKGGSLHIYGLNDHGGDPSRLTGTAQGSDNIEAYDTTKLYEAWAQQNLFDDRLSMRFGLYDLNSEFDVIETSRVFINPSQGIGPDISQTGVHGPSIFPNTSVGGRVSVKPSPWSYVQAAVLDAIAGDPGNPSGTQITFGHDGTLIVTETGIEVGKDEKSTIPFGKYAIGGWVYTGQFQKLDGSGKDTGNHGIYGFVEQQVYQKAGSHTQGLALFFRAGVANQDFNQFNLYLGGGAVYTGLIPSRDGDQLGVSVACAHNGDQFRQAAETAGTPVDDAETIIEATYRACLTPWLAIQPDVQYAIDPGTNPRVANSLLIGSRVEVDF